MSYYISKTLRNADFEESVAKITEELRKEGFGILTEIDIKGTLKKKLDVDFYNYRILGLVHATHPMPSRPCRRKTRLAPCSPAM